MICKGCRFRAICLVDDELPHCISNRLMRCHCETIWFVKGSLAKSLRLERLGTIYLVCCPVASAVNYHLRTCPKCEMPPDDYYTAVIGGDADNKLHMVINANWEITKMIRVESGGPVPTSVWLPGKGWHDPYSAKMREV